MGPCEVIPRSKAWNLVSQELLHNSLHHDWNRPVSEIRDAMIEVIPLMARNEFPLSAPPRWVAELLWVLSHIVKLELRPRNLSIVPPTNFDVECQTYVELVWAIWK